MYPTYFQGIRSTDRDVQKGNERSHVWVRRAAAKYPKPVSLYQKVARMATLMHHGVSLMMAGSWHGPIAPVLAKSRHHLLRLLTPKV